MKLRSFSPVGNQVVAHCSQFAAYLFLDGHHPDADCELAVITLETPLEKIHSISSGALVWEEIHQAWQQIGESPSQGDLAAWRLIYRYGEEISPGLRMFRLRECKTPHYFYLVSQKEPLAAAARLNDVLFSLSTWHHVDHGKCVFHAAGVVHQDFVHLFVGVSGAGKSTVAAMSKTLGYTIIHDDHLVVYPDLVGNYLVTDISLSTPGVPLRSIFFLNQDTTDRLVPLSTLATTKGLLDGFLDIVGEHLLTDQLLRYAFAFSSDIARRTPGYELHFRKAPEFWKLIDEQFPA